LICVELRTAGQPTARTNIPTRQCDPARPPANHAGAAVLHLPVRSDQRLDHFRTSVSKGLEIIDGLRGHTTGYAVPSPLGSQTVLLKGVNDSVPVEKYQQLHLLREEFDHGQQLRRLLDRHRAEQARPGHRPAAL